MEDGKKSRIFLNGSGAKSACVKTWLSLIAFCFCTATQSQNIETDSLKRSLAISKEDPQRVLILESLSYAYLSSYPDTALQYALQGLELAKKIEDRKGEAYCINALGNVYFSVGDYSKALEMYLQSLHMKEALNIKQHSIAVTYFNIADVYTEEEDYSRALYYLFKTKAVDEKEKDSSGILFDLYSLSSIYLRKKKNDSALYYTQQAYQLAQRLLDQNLMAAIINNFGEIYLSLKNFGAAKNYFQLSVHYAKAVNDNEVLATDYLSIAKVFKESNDPDSSIVYARNAVLLAQQAPFLKQLLEASTFLADAFKTQGKYDSAFRYQQLSIAAKDSLVNVEKLKKVQNLKLLEQQRQQSIEVAKIEFENKIKLYSLVFISVVFLLVAILLWRNNKQKNKAYLQVREEKLKTEEAYKELKSTQAQLIHAEKMALLGELTAGIAHEIQNPLNFVNNFSEINKEILQELRAERLKPTGKRNEQTENEIINDVIDNEEKINHHGKRADAIVKSMLQHSRKSTGQKESTNINTLCDECVRLAYHGMRAKDKSFNAEIITDFDASIEKINIIPQDIERVLLNLFSNAFYAVCEKKKTADGNYQPSVTVATKLSDPSALGRLGNDVEIRISDNGNGIPQNIVDKIFQPFFTTKPTGQGTGLGLSLSYDIIKAHGGEIRVETKESAGSEFIITLKS